MELYGKKNKIKKYVFIYCFRFFKTIKLIGSDRGRFCFLEGWFSEITAIVAQLARAADL